MIRAIRFAALAFAISLGGCGDSNVSSPATIVATPSTSSGPFQHDRFTVTKSDVGFQSTLAQLLTALDRRDLTVFAVIDHAAGAENVGLELPPTTLVIFGNPSAGTPLMETQPLVGAELPLKALVYQQGDDVFLAMTGMSYLERNYNLTTRSALVDRIKDALDAIAVEATSP